MVVVNEEPIGGPPTGGRPRARVGTPEPGELASPEEAIDAFFMRFCPDGATGITSVEKVRRLWDKMMERGEKVEECCQKHLATRVEANDFRQKVAALTDENARLLSTVQSVAEQSIERERDRQITHGVAMRRVCHENNVLRAKNRRMKEALNRLRQQLSCAKGLLIELSKDEPETAPEPPRSCGRCLQHLTNVRPGKWQCDNPECVYTKTYEQLRAIENDYPITQQTFAGDSTKDAATRATPDEEILKTLASVIRESTESLHRTVSPPAPLSLFNPESEPSFRVVYWVDVPDEQREPLGKWLEGQTMCIGERGQAVYAWDYQRWYEGWVKGEEAKVYD